MNTKTSDELKNYTYRTSHKISKYIHKTDVKLKPYLSKRISFIRKIICSCLFESSKANTLSLRTSAISSAYGDLCMNRFLALTNEDSSTKYALKQVVT